MYNKRILGIPDYNVRAFMKYVWRQVHVNKFGFFGVMTGLPGHGKTYTSMAFMWLQDTTFNQDTLKYKMCSKPRDFLKAINELKKYEWAAWMDTGLSTSLSARNWQKITNTMVNDTTMLMRIKKMGIVFDSQLMAYVDKSTRSLFQFFFEIQRFETQPPVVSVHKISISQRYGKTYFPHPIFLLDGRMAKLARFTVKGMLPKNMLREFEELQIAAKEQILKQHYKMLEDIEKQENPMNRYEMINYVKENLDDFMIREGNIDLSLVKSHFEIGRGKADEIKKLIEMQLRKK